MFVVLLVGVGPPLDPEARMKSLAFRKRRSRGFALIQMTQPDRQNVMGMRVIGPTLDRSSRAFHRLVILPDVEIGTGEKRQVHVPLWVLRIQPLGLFHHPDALWIASKVEFVAERVETVCVVGIQLHRSSSLGDREIDFVTPDVRGTQEVVGGRGRIVKRHCPLGSLVELRHKALAVAGMLQHKIAGVRPGQISKSLAVGRVKSYGTLEHFAAPGCALLRKLVKMTSPANSSPMHLGYPAVSLWNA